MLQLRMFCIYKQISVNLSNTLSCNSNTSQVNYFSIAISICMENLTVPLVINFLEHCGIDRYPIIIKNL